MKYLSSYLLCYINGNKSPSREDIEKVLCSVGIEPEPERINLLLKSIEGKNISELITQGMGSKYYQNNF